MPLDGRMPEGKAFFTMHHLYCIDSSNGLRKRQQYIILLCYIIQVETMGVVQRCDEDSKPINIALLANDFIDRVSEYSIIGLLMN